MDLMITTTLLLGDGFLTTGQWDRTQTEHGGPNEPRKQRPESPDMMDGTMQEVGEPKSLNVVGIGGVQDAQGETARISPQSGSYKVENRPDIDIDIEVEQC